MNNVINIKYESQMFPYLIEYESIDIAIDNDESNNKIKYRNDNGIIRLYDDTLSYYKHENEWYQISFRDMESEYVPASVPLSNIRIHIPDHSIDTYTKKIRYALTAYTWINGNKIDFGTRIFKINDTYANSNGIIKRGNNEYRTCIDFTIADVFYIIYGDDWKDFRHKVCGEPEGMNATVPPLYLSLYAVDEYDGRYILKDGIVGGSICFNISKDSDILQLKIDTVIDPLGFEFKLNMNRVYDWFTTYLSETYQISPSHRDIELQLAIKSKNAIIEGPSVKWDAPKSFGECYQRINWSNIPNDSPFKIFFNTWDRQNDNDWEFEEGWNIVGSLNVANTDEEIFTIISNELPITQEVFSLYTNGGSEKIIDMSDMNITKYSLVNKIENSIVTIERPTQSKSSIQQTVFFKVNDAELLTLHPNVTENVCINLDDYKTKTSKLILQVEGCKFNAIGENRYGTIFEITANTIPSSAISGTYYILDENLTLITTGKYNCVR